MNYAGETVFIVVAVAGGEGVAFSFAFADDPADQVAVLVVVVFDGGVYCLRHSRQGGQGFGGVDPAGAQVFVVAGMFGGVDVVAGELNLFLYFVGCVQGLTGEQQRRQAAGEGGGGGGAAGCYICAVFVGGVDVHAGGGCVYCRAVAGEGGPLVVCVGGGYGEAVFAVGGRVGYVGGAAVAGGAADDDAAVMGVSHGVF